MAPPQSQQKPDPPAKLYRVPAEEALFLIEDDLRLLARHIRNLSISGILEFFPKDFQGSLLLSRPEGTGRLTSASGVEIRTWKNPLEPRGGRKELEDSLEKFFTPLARFTFGGLKPATIRVTGDTCTCLMKVGFGVRTISGSFLERRHCR